MGSGEHGLYLCAAREEGMARTMLREAVRTAVVVAYGLLLEGVAVLFAWGVWKWWM